MQSPMSAATEEAGGLCEVGFQQSTDSIRLYELTPTGDEGRHRTGWQKFRRRVVLRLSAAGRPHAVAAVRYIAETRFT